MIEIAICDDNISELSNIEIILAEYQKINGFMYEFSYDLYHTAIELLAAIEAGKHYEIIFLDIIMPLMNGVEAAKEIRTWDKVVKIVFLTSSQEFALDSYQVDAFYYALKPIKKINFFSIMDKLFSEIKEKAKDSILVKCKNGLTKIPLHTLEYVEIVERIIYYHLNSGEILKETGVMINLEQILLRYPQFVKPHRSFIINLDRIDILSSREITCYSNAKVPIAKANYKNIKQKYMDRIFRKVEVNMCL